METVLLLAPEMILGLMGLLFLVLSTFQRHAKRDYGIAFAVVLAAGLFSLMSLNSEAELFSGAYKIDFFSQIFKFILLAGLLLVIWLSRKIADLDERVGAEYYYFLFSAALGFILLPSAVEFITLFVCLELSSIALYILIPLRKGDGPDAEAGLKYFFMSAAASAVLLFGASLLYGVVQTTDLFEAAHLLSQGDLPVIAYVALTLISVSFFFKLAVAPFHFWAPDVYQSANHQVVALIASLSKVVAIALLLRFIPLAHGAGKAVFVLGVLSVVSMTLGNLAAIWQQDIKRLMAYSSIAQAGYILIGFLAFNKAGIEAVFYYAATYMFATLAVFHVIVTLSKEGKNLKLDDFIGLSKSSPILALVLLLSFFSLAGIPPLVGFAAKWFVFTAAVAQGHVLLVLFAFIMSVVSLYYYLMVIKRAYVDQPAESAPAIDLSWDERLISLGLIGFMVVFGLFPGWILSIGEKVATLL